MSAQKTKVSTEATSKGKTSKAFSDEERAAMQIACQGDEGKRQGGRRGRRAGEDRRVGRTGSHDGQATPRDHHGQRPGRLTPKLWYGQPAYARDGKVVCFFQAASKFKTRYATLGFNDAANLDEGGMWPTAFGLRS